MTTKKRLLLLVGVPFVALLTIVAIVVIAKPFVGEKPEYAYIYVTTEGFGEEKDVDRKLLTITPGESVADVFSLKYEEYYQFFEKPLVKANEFIDFFGKRKAGGAKIRVYIDDVLTLDIEQAYLGTDSNIKIVYTK